MSNEPNARLTAAQEAARAKRCKTYLDKVKAIRSGWKAGDRFSFTWADGNVSIGAFIEVCDSLRTSFPYFVRVRWRDGSKEGRIGTSSFFQRATKLSPNESQG